MYIYRVIANFMKKFVPPPPSKQDKLEAEQRRLDYLAARANLYAMRETANNERDYNA